MKRNPMDRSGDAAGWGGGTSPLTPEAILDERRLYGETGGESSVCAREGFVPAFRDDETGTVYRARFRDGRPAPMHLLDGLPDAVVLTRDAQGRVLAVKPSLTSGFLLCGCFYSRAEAAAVVVT
ncbi:hypothetical protein [Aquisalimonas asiatica]|uniref:Uncharacterized protein n=1 Tax=Aquisalimonas asiatica TaxID=406100 RepID=A0A1H8Q2E4_9GAMM|nr:hypothetical protein [Aquisalimonas asiatica]SEO47933.1 hypothetical protein SAMN04488052_101284 [Aquisalimonas asiatica]